MQPKRATALSAHKHRHGEQHKRYDEHRADDDFPIAGATRLHVVGKAATSLAHAATRPKARLHYAAAD